MVDMRMGDQNRMDGGRLERKVPVLFFGLLPAALVQAAIEEIMLAAGFQVVHGARNHARRTVES